jgi:copper chaperone CopZ
MACGHCEEKVKKALSDVEGVTKVDASSESKRARIHYKGQEAPDLDTVNAALQDSGYFAEA